MEPMHMSASVYQYSNLLYRICYNEELTFKMISAENYKNVVISSQIFSNTASSD